MSKMLLPLLAFAAAGLLALPAGAVTIAPGPNVQETLQEALILAKPGDVIELEAGTYAFTMGLSLDVDDVTLRGQGTGKTILSFKDQNAGSEGLIVTSTGVTLEDFAVEDTIGDAIKAKGADGITFRNIRTEWTGGPKPTNGSYGLYPVESENVLIDGCESIGASDAGIYVGQCKHVIVRHSTAKYNVAGIEIENCYYADVYDNLATHNTGGILVFDLPNLPQQGGHDVRVYDNRSVDNDTENFAPEGAIVGYVPTGTGLLVMANRNVEIFNNDFSGNGTGNVMIRSYMPYSDEKMDPKYYPYPQNIYIHDNRFGRGGFKPMGVRGELFARAAGGAPIPDIMWDGRIDKIRVRDGKLPANHNIVIENNGDADFINLNLDAFLERKTPQPSRDITAHSGMGQALARVKLPQDS